MLSDLDHDKGEKDLHALDFLVVQDIFLTETAKSADIVLPTVSFAEKGGSVTNTGIEGMCSKDKKVSRGRLSDQLFR